MLLDKLRAERFEFSKFCVQSGLIVHTAAWVVNRYYDLAMTEVNVDSENSPLTQVVSFKSKEL